RAPGGEVDAGEHDLRAAVRDQAFDLLHDVARRRGARVSTAVRDHAERAAMVAAVLHLHVGAGAFGKAIDQMRGGFAHGHDVADADALAARLEALGAHLFSVADDAADFGHRREAVGVDLHGAAGDDDLGVRAISAGAADGLARLAHGFGGDGAGVDDHRIV